MRKITQMENARTALMKVESLIREDVKNNCNATSNQCIALGIITTVLTGKSWMAGVEVESWVNQERD